MIDLRSTFQKFDGDYNRFDGAIENLPNRRKDLSAFIILDRLVPGYVNIINAAAHDQIWLDADLSKLAAVATEDDIRTLVRCGVHYDWYVKALSMFV